MKIVMIGAGYVGLTTGACLAQFGHTVTCVDVDAAKVEALRQARIPIYEPGLSDLVASLTSTGHIKFDTSIEEPVATADAVFLAVGTPALPDGDTDLRYILAAAEAVAPVMRNDAVLVIKSTVPAGTAARVRELVARVRGGRPLSVASNPEFLREGSALSDFMAPDRVVIGADDPHAEALLRRLYQPLSRRAPIRITSTVNAELIKYSANALLAIKIGFINDIADLCEAAGGDIRDVAEGIGLDRRIGKAFLQPGPGFGGSCFPKDTRSLAFTGRKFGAEQPLVEVLIQRNEQRKQRLAERVAAELAPGSTVAVLGTAFKAETDDVRESAALAVIPALREAGLRVRAYDPKARHTTLAAIPDLDWAETPYAAAEGAQAVVILTEWEEFKSLDMTHLSQVMDGDLVFDFRNLLDDEALESTSLRLVALGRAVPKADRSAALKTGGGAISANLAASPL